LAFTSIWKGCFNYQYIGSRYSNNTATGTDEQKKLGIYHLVDAQISYEGMKNTAFRAGIKNLLDEAYEWQYGYPSEGQSFYLSLE
jgi:outer membrane cobalamin receptor